MSLARKPNRCFTPYLRHQVKPTDMFGNEVSQSVAKERSRKVSLHSILLLLTLATILGILSKCLEDESDIYLRRLSLT